MIEDDIIRELRAVREAYARLHNYDVHAMVADLQARNLADDWPVVSHPPRRIEVIAAPTAAPKQPLPSTEQVSDGSSKGDAVPA